MTYPNPWELLIPVISAVTTLPLALTIIKVSTLETRGSGWHRCLQKQAKRSAEGTQSRTKQECTDTTTSVTTATSEAGDGMAGELDGAGCTCRSGRSEGEGTTKDDLAAGDVAVKSATVDNNGTGKTTTETRAEEEGATGPSKAEGAGAGLVEKEAVARSDACW
jgi:hypothetical protein